MRPRGSLVVIRLFAPALLVLAAVAVRAQIDPDKRTQLEAGYESGLGQPGPVSPYIYLYLNRTGVFHSSDTLRIALAPVYLDGELGFPDAFGLWSDAAVGLSGGGYAYGQTEVYRGDNRRGESFIGHGGGPSISAYPHLGHLGPAPLSGVLRLSGFYADYIRDYATDPRFVLPPDEWTGVFRGGLRLGGQEPGLDTAPAGEASAWWESHAREHSALYGYDGDRIAEGRTNLFWTRILFDYTTGAGTRMGAGASAGGGTGVDRFTAYRLGGMMTQNAEFPLILPGYFAQEIAARQYAHVWIRGGVPLDDQKKYTVNVFAAGASITPVPGTDAGGARHAGAGTSIEFTPPKGALHAMLAYGYSPTAVRGGRRGGDGVALTVELNFEAPPKSRRRPVNAQQGLRWLLGPIGI